MVISANAVFCPRELTSQLFDSSYHELIEAGEWYSECLCQAVEAPVSI